MKRQKWLIKSLSTLMACILITGMLAIPVSAEGTNDTFGSVSYFSTASPGDELSDSYYYTDDWFFENNSARNDALALVSMQLVAASVDEDGYGTGFLTDLGFEDVKYVRAGTSGSDMCHYITGRKSIQKDGSSKTVTAVVMESYSFEFAPTMAAFFHPAGWQVWATYGGKNGGTKDDAYIQAMETAKAMNEKNDYMLELTATDLIMEDGKVAGVTVTASAGGAGGDRRRMDGRFAQRRPGRRRDRYGVAERGRHEDRHGGHSERARAEARQGRVERQERPALRRDAGHRHTGGGFARFRPGQLHGGGGVPHDDRWHRHEHVPLGSHDGARLVEGDHMER